MTPPPCARSDAEVARTLHELLDRFDEDPEAAFRRLAELAATRTEESRNLEALPGEAQAEQDRTLEKARVATFDWDVPNDRLRGNALLGLFYGFTPTPEGAPIASFLQAMHPDEREARAAALRRAILTAGPYESRYRVTGADGKERWVLARGDVRLDADGKPHRVTGVVLDITDTVQADQARQESERRLRTALRSGRMGTWDLDLATGELVCSDTCRANYGRGPDEPFGYDDVASTVVPEDRDRWHATIKAAIARAEEFEMEYRVHWPDGSLHWVQIRGGCIKDQEGRVLALSGVSFDITHRRTVEEERERLVEQIEVERSRLRTMLENAPAFIAVLRGRDLVFEHVNAAYYGIVGYRPLLGRPLAQAMPEAVGLGEGQDYDRLLLGIMDRGEPVTFEARPVFVQKSPGGELEKRFLDLSYQPLRDEQGAVDGILVLGVDVTDQARSRFELAEREELFRTVFEQAPDDAILVMDRDCVLTAWNPAAERIMGWTAAEAIGRSATLIFTPEDQDAGIPEWETETAAREGKVAEERWHLRKDGSRFWGSGTLNALHDAEGGVRGFLKVFRDATARHELERRTQELNAELERMVEARTEALQEAVREAEAFNYSIAHDLRAPLRAIVSTARMLQEDAGSRLDDEHLELLDRQAHNAVRLGTLIDELLRLSRLARAEIRRESLDVTAQVRRVVAELDVSCGPSIEVQEGMTASADAGLVRMVFQNLLENACKFSPHGGTVRVGETDGVFWVRDEGVGFDMAFAPKIFLPFERLVSEAEFEGTGIGLANVERIVRRHGGRVWVESAPGAGTTFSFTLGDRGTADSGRS